MAINSTAHIWREAEITVSRATEVGPLNIHIKEEVSELTIYFQCEDKFSELLTKMQEAKGGENERIDE